MADVYYLLEEIYMDDNYCNKARDVGYFKNYSDAETISKTDCKDMTTNIRRVAYRHRIFDSCEQFRRVHELDRMAALMARLSDDDVILLKQKFNTDSIVSIPKLD